MRKMSMYARKKRAGIDATYNGAAWAEAIQRSRPYSDEVVVQLPGAEATQGTADRAQILVREAYNHIKAGVADPLDSLERDRLAHAIGVSKLRAIEIAGEDPFTNHMLPIIHAAEQAVLRMDARYFKLKRWGFDGPALEAMAAMVDLYETIIQASSPAQMAAAADARMAILKAQGVLE